MKEATEQERTAFVMSTRDTISKKIEESFPKEWLIAMPKHGKKFHFVGFDGLVFSRRSCGPLVKIGKHFFFFCLKFEQWVHVGTGAKVSDEFYQGVERIKSPNIVGVIASFQSKHPDCKEVKA